MGAGKVCFKEVYLMMTAVIIAFDLHDKSHYTWEETTAKTMNQCSALYGVTLKLPSISDVGRYTRTLWGSRIIFTITGGRRTVFSFFLKEPSSFNLFFSFLFIYFYWHTVDLQCFRCSTKLKHHNMKCQHPIYAKKHTQPQTPVRGTW